MLERALRRERGMNVDDGARVEAEPSIAAPRPAATTHAAGFTSTRALLKQYLQEVGYVAAEEADHDYQAALERAAHTYPRKPFYDHEDDYHGTNETLNHGLFTMAKAPTAVKSTLPAAFESGTVDILKRPVASAASASDQKENYERASVTVTDTESMTSKTSEGSPTTDLDEVGRCGALSMHVNDIHSPTP